MSAADKVRITAEKFSGEFKQQVGRATGDRELRFEGHVQKAKANLRQVAEKVKDTFRR